jgi:hypothetical protein
LIEIEYGLRAQIGPRQSQHLVQRSSATSP